MSKRIRNKQKKLPLSKKRIHNPEEFKVNDFVTVTGPAEDKEGGWNNIWVPGMDEFIGKTSKILKRPGNSDLRNHGYQLQLNKPYISYCFPSFVLKLSTEEKHHDN